MHSTDADLHQLREQMKDSSGRRLQVGEEALGLLMGATVSTSTLLADKVTFL